MDPVEAVVKKRMQVLVERDRPFAFEDDYMDTEAGLRGLIRVSGADGDIVGLEFIEPEEFWMDPDAVDEYKETAEGGFHVTIIVPTEDLEDARALLREEVGEGVMVIGYDDLSSPLGIPTGR